MRMSYQGCTYKNFQIWCDYRGQCKLCSLPILCFCHTKKNVNDYWLHGWIQEEVSSHLYLWHTSGPGHGPDCGCYRQGYNLLCFKSYNYDVLLLIVLNFSKYIYHKAKAISAKLWMSLESFEKGRRIPEKALSKSWESPEKVLRKSWQVKISSSILLCKMGS